VLEPHAAATIAHASAALPFGKLRASQACRGTRFTRRRRYRSDS
jgi:hypothetical protein